MADLYAIMTRTGLLSSATRTARLSVMPPLVRQTRNTAFRTGGVTVPDLYMICGPNGAGKSTWTKGIASRKNVFCIDTDALAAGGLSPIAAGKASIEMAVSLIARRVSFARESTLTAKFDFQIMQKAKDCGYAIHLTYIRLASPDLAISRVLSRVRHGGHDVPEIDIRRRFKRSFENLPKALGMVDDYVILDNSGNAYRIVEKN